VQIDCCVSIGTPVLGGRLPWETGQVRHSLRQGELLRCCSDFSSPVTRRGEGGAGGEARRWGRGLCLSKNRASRRQVLSSAVFEECPLLMTFQWKCVGHGGHHHWGSRATIPHIPIHRTICSLDVCGICIRMAVLRPKHFLFP